MKTDKRERFPTPVCEMQDYIDSIDEGVVSDEESELIAVNLSGFISKSELFGMSECDCIGQLLYAKEKK